MALSDVLTHVRRLVNDEPYTDQLSASYTAAAVQISVDLPNKLEYGDVLDFYTVSSGGSYEQMQVVDTADPVANAVDVRIGWNDTTNQNHADNAPFFKNPRYGTDQIVKAATHVVDTMLWPDIFLVTSSTITPSPSTTNLYDAPSDFLDVVDYRRGLVQTASSAIEDLSYSPYEIVDTVPSAISSTLKAVRVTQWARTDVNATFFYKAKVTTTNMTSEMEPVIAYGTAAVLLKGEIQEKADRPDPDDLVGRMNRFVRDIDRQFDNERKRLRQKLLKQWGVPARRFRHPATRY